MKKESMICQEQFKIRNTISTADLKQYVDIYQFNEYSWGRFDIVGNYNGKVGYVKDDSMEGRITVFLSGKLISTGAKSLVKSIDQLQRTHDLLCKYEFIKPISITPKIQNIVATFDLKKYIDFSEVIKKRKVIYEPEQFPGMIYKTTSGTTCLVFASGKVVIVGSKSEEQIVDTIEELVNL
jgi:transcription initiation factor TFIID TATA-box-binding protein